MEHVDQEEVEVYDDEAQLNGVSLVSDSDSSDSEDEINVELYDVDDNEVIGASSVLPIARTRSH